MEPRAYSASPIGTNFLEADYFRTTGDVSLDSSLPITDVSARINLAAMAYSRTFDLFGQTGSFSLLAPYVWADVSGKVFENSKEVSRSGLGDFRLRFSENLLGSPALTPKQFALREPTTTVGTSLTVVAPTGQYNSEHLINISSHRWAFKPEIGLSQPFGSWFTEGSAGVWVFTNNSDFFRGHERGQNPIWAFQAHVGYNFLRPDLWMSVDGTYYRGGETSIDGVTNNDSQSVTRAGLKLSLPLSEGLSIKATWSTWVTARNGGTFDIFILTLQYRWFDS